MKCEHAELEDDQLLNDVGALRHVWNQWIEVKRPDRQMTTRKENKEQFDKCDDTDQWQKKYKYRKSNKYGTKEGQTDKRWPERVKLVNRLTMKVMLMMKTMMKTMVIMIIINDDGDDGDDDDIDGDDQSDVYMSRVRRTNDVRTSKSDICCELSESE